VNEDRKENRNIAIIRSVVPKPEKTGIRAAAEEDDCKLLYR